MDTEDRRSISKRAIFNAVNSATNIAHVRFTAFVFGIFGMLASDKVWTFFTKQSSTLFLFGFFGRNFTETRLPNFLSRFFRTHITTGTFKNIWMTLFQMLLLRKTFQIFNAVVSFITINVVNMLGWIKIFEPASCYNSVHKSFSPERQIAIMAFLGDERGELSKNFSAPRYSIKMVKSSIFDTIYGKANHGDPFGVVTVITT